jgi:two-component system response regulator AtoC
LPPLRSRKEDIPALLDFLLKKYASLFGRPTPSLSTPTMDLLLGYAWPGNIRELENFARKMVALANEQLAIFDLASAVAQKVSEPEPLPAKITENGNNPGRSLKEAAREASRHAERAMILNQLERTHWNRKRTARELQISYKALLYKLKQLGLDSSDRAEQR